MELEDKVGSCLRCYGDLAKQGGSGDEDWKTIYDLQMFSKSICICECELQEEIEGEDSITVEQILKDHFVVPNYIGEQYRIDYCPVTKLVGIKQFDCLYLCYMAFVVWRGKMDKIKHTIDFFYYKKRSSHAETVPDKEEEEKYSKEIDPDEILDLIRRTFPDNFGLRVSLQSKFNKSCNFKKGNITKGIIF